MSHTERHIKISIRSARILVGLALMASVAVLTPAPATASFTRRPLREVPPAASGKVVPGGLAIDAKDDLWVENRGDSLAEFAPAYAGENGFLTELPVTGQDNLEHLGIEFASEDFAVVGTNPQLGGGSVEVYNGIGEKIREWGNFTDPTIAIDNAPDGSIEDPSACGSLPLAPGECFVYVTETSGNGGVMRFNLKGEAEPFEFAQSCPEAPECYVAGNKIGGIPGQPKGIFGESGLAGVVVDSEGDIYAANTELHAVYEYRPSGQFVQEFQLQSPEVPRLEGVVGFMSGVAIDARSKHLLVPITTTIPGGAQVGAIDEFSTETGKYVARVTESPGGGQLERPRALALDARGDLYVVDIRRGSGGLSEGVVSVYESGHFDPSVMLGSTSGRRPSGATLNGAVNPEGLELTECEFQYVPAKQFEEEGFAHPATAECKPHPSSIPSDDQSHSVRATVMGLEAGTTYRYRLLAHSAGELGGTGVTQALAFTAPAAPVVVSESASHISSEFADLSADIDPRGVRTTYHFEYLTVAAYQENRESFTGPRSATTTPIPDASIGSGGATGSGPESAVINVGGLLPGSEYRFRVVASNECEALDNPGHECVSNGESQTFTTLPAAHAGLPDGRAYELVTPADKEGGSDMFAEEEANGEFFNEKSTGIPSRDGNSFLLSTFSPFGAFPSAGESSYVFKRDPADGRWTFASLASRVLGVQAIRSSIGVLFDPLDFSRVAFQDSVGSVLSEEGETHLDLVGPPGAPNPLCPVSLGLAGALDSGCYMALHADPHLHRGELSGEANVETRVVGGSLDLSHVVLESNEKGACAPVVAALKVTTGDVLCEWDGGFETSENGETRPALKLVNLAPGSEVEPTSTCGAQLGGGESLVGGTSFRAVSADGSRVFFTSPQIVGRQNATPIGKGCWNGGTAHAPQVYMRAGGQTVEISAPEAGVSDPTGQHIAEYAGASEDGSRVFFETSTELTAKTAALGLHDRELYEYDTDTGSLKWISGGEDGEAAAAVFAVAAVPSDGSSVYFLANGVLASNIGADGTHAAPGHCGEDQAADTEGEICSLYRYDTSTQTTSYIASVNDRAFTEVGEHRPRSGADSDWYTTPDGRFLLFKSNVALTSFSNAGTSCLIRVGGGAPHGPCAELYRYDAQASEAGEQSLVCVSCGTDGALPTGNAEFDRSGAEGPANGPVVGMSDNGAYVFFDTSTKLVPQAENHTLAVYEWHEGHVSLLSSPNDPFPSYFLGYSPYYTPNGTKVEGGNVFVGTHAQLVPQETNAVGNIYDARICLAESPCISPPPGEAVQCEGGACQTPPVTPAVRTPTSMTFSGAGNTSPALTATTHPAPTQAQKLAGALRTCRKDKSRHKRQKCERQARKRYAPTKKKGHR